MRFRVLAVVTMLTGGMLLVGGVSVASQRTMARIYRAFKSNGKPAIHISRTVSGSCFSGSSEADRNDAWRCISANFLYDPCFSSSSAHGVVVCVAKPWKSSGVELKLTKALPNGFGDKRKPSTRGQPWGIETFSGLKCTLDGMGPFINATEFGDYFCGRGVWLWDLPSRGSQPWTIYVAPAGARRLTSRTKIRVAWF